VSFSHRRNKITTRLAWFKSSAILVFVPQDLMVTHNMEQHEFGFEGGDGWNVQVKKSQIVPLV
jgi:hypothetical protein